MEPGVIREFRAGHFSGCLDYPLPAHAGLLVDPEVAYVWVIGHEEGGVDWETYDGRLFGRAWPANDLRVRGLTGDFLLRTEDFVAMSAALRHSIHLIQLPQVPPYWFRGDVLRGKTKYEMLAEHLDYYLELDIAGARDIGTVVSRDRAVVEQVVKVVADVVAGGA